MNPTEDNTTVPSAVNASNTKHLLRNAYDIYTDELPLQACKSQWKKENVFGFLMGMGVAEYGDETHLSSIYSAPNDPGFSWRCNRCQSQGEEYNFTFYSFLTQK
jgi:hypothetical protein